MADAAEKCGKCKGPKGACICVPASPLPPTDEDKRLAALPAHIIGAPGWSPEAEKKRPGP